MSTSSVVRPAVYRPIWLSNPELDGNFVDDRLNQVIDDTLLRLQGVRRPTPQWDLRFRAGMAFLYPYLASCSESLGKLSALEVGCGTGPKSIGLAQVFRRYVGIDLDADAIKSGEAIARHLKLANLDLVAGEAADIDQVLCTREKFDVIILHAVVEHLTIQERLELLGRLWEYLDDNGILYVGELPNRLGPVDHHSSYLAYFNGLPDELALRYVEHSRRRDYVERVKSGNPQVELYRNGRAVSYHEFELAIAPCSELNGFVRADAWHGPMLNLHPLQRYERELLEQFLYLKNRDTTQMTQIPPGFARYWLYFIFRKRTQHNPLWPRFVDEGLACASDGPRVDAFANRVLELREPLRIAVPGGARCLTLGLLRDAAAGASLRIESADHTLFFEGSVAELSQALGDHWNPQVFLSVRVRGAQEIVVHACGAQPLRLVHAFFR